VNTGQPRRCHLGASSALLLLDLIDLICEVSALSEDSEMLIAPPESFALEHSLPYMSLKIFVVEVADALLGFAGTRSVR
jgi:hypothetical protein